MRVWRKNRFIVVVDRLFPPLDESATRHSSWWVVHTVVR